jgi:23S rRNA (cytidine1920-2'-O)/16S rRNA (cytidine1409-2'-O)-methyltransferase
VTVAPSRHRAAGEEPFASRGGEKLEAALDRLGVLVGGRRVLDAGASTGGFTDCLLRRGARSVVAVDVAYGAIAWRLRNDERVTLLERTNVRHLRLEQIDAPVQLAVADLAFISLVAVRDAILGVCTPDAELLLLVKPQFEAPRAAVGRGGVVREPAEWIRSMRAVADAYRAAGCSLAGACASPLVGPAGNREFFLHLGRDGRADEQDGALALAAGEAP